MLEETHISKEFQKQQKEQFLNRVPTGQLGEPFFVDNPGMPSYPFLFLFNRNLKWE